MNSIAVKEANRGDLKDFLRLHTVFYNEPRLKQGLRTYNVNELRDDAERVLARDKVFLAKDGEGKPVGFIRISTLLTTRKAIPEAPRGIHGAGRYRRGTTENTRERPRNTPEQTFIGTINTLES